MTENSQTGYGATSEDSTSPSATLTSASGTGQDATDSTTAGGSENSADPDSSEANDSDSTTEVESTSSDGTSSTDTDTGTSECEERCPAPNLCLADQCLPPWCQGLLTFDECNLETAVRVELGDFDMPFGGDLTLDNTAEVDFLRAEIHELSSLGGIECLVALDELYLANNQITDLGPLAGP